MLKRRVQKFRRNKQVIENGVLWVITQGILMKKEFSIKVIFRNMCCETNLRLIILETRNKWCNLFSETSKGWSLPHGFPKIDRQWEYLICQGTN